MEENKNLVTVESDVDELLDDELAALLEETVNTALTLEGVALPCEVNILLTDDEGIQEVNRQGITVLLVEQNAKMALSISDRAYVLETGTISIQGNAAELLNDPRVKKAYLGQ